MNLLTISLILSLSRYVRSMNSESINNISEANSSLALKKECVNVLTNREDWKILQIFHLSFHTVLNAFVLNSESNNCENYVAECEDREELNDCINRTSRLMGNTHIKEKVNILILFTKRNPLGIIKNDEQLGVNFLIVRKVWEQEPSVGTQNLISANNEELILHAPFINKSISTNISLHTVHVISNLFEEQKIYFNQHKIKNNVFRISLFECPPFVIYQRDKLDGIEIRIVKEIFKERKLRVLHRDFSINITDPWSKVKEDVAKNQADLAMCSIWLTNDNWSNLDFSQQYSSVCATFLVPRPVLMNPAVYLFLPLNKLVWFGLLISISITIAWLYLVAKADKLSVHSIWDNTPYISVVYCFIMVINMATLHGPTTFPSQLSFKIMVTFWMITCILVSTAYSSGYTSLLTFPQYARKIETLQDMVDEDVYWGDIQKNPPTEWNHNEKMREIIEKRKQKRNTSELIRSIEENNCAIVVKRLGFDYITDTERFRSVSEYLMCLKECIRQYFVVFALRKNSFYKDMVNKRVVALLESGIISHWQTDIIRNLNNTYVNRFFEEHRNIKNEPFSLSVSHTRGAFYLLGSGLLLASLIFLNEILGKIRFHPLKLRVEN